MAITILLIIVAYFWGAIPVANFVSKSVRGVDLRDYGSGSVSPSNAGEAVGRWATIVVGAIDVLKGAAPVWAAQLLDQGLAQQMSAGIAGLVGHNWSLWVGFKGGRGFTILLGILLSMARLELLLFTVIALFGIALWGAVPLFLALAAVLLPLWSWLLERNQVHILGLGLVVIFIFAKRILGNALPRDPSLRVFLYRLVFDRDTRDRSDWVRREIETPPSPEASIPESGVGPDPGPGSLP